MGRGALDGRDVAVIGGGIGGLTAALCLARRGASVTVHEQADAFREVGAGLQITPNGGRVLHALDLEQILDARSVRARTIEAMDGLTGRAVARFDLDGLGGPPYRLVHRADLVDILVTACRDAGVSLCLGRRIADVGRDGTFTSSGRPVAPYLTVGADGLHSVARPEINGSDDPFFTGQVAWRAVIDFADADPAARIWMAPGRHVVTYPLSQGRLNIVAVQERRAWAAEGWNHAGDPASLRTAFAGLSGRVTGLLNRVDEVGEWGLFRHPVAPRWHGDALALLGDAAHPTLPFLAQGANLAIEDAWALAACCDAAPLDTALPRYQSLRKPRVTRAIAGANANAVNYHLGGLRRRAALAALAAAGRVAPGAFLRRYGWLHGFDVTRT